MSKENICGPNCPKVKEQLRAAIEERPWLLDEIFPRRKDDADSRLPWDFVSRDTGDERERAIEPPLDRREQVAVDVPSKTMEDVIKPEKIDLIVEESMEPSWEPDALESKKHAKADEEEEEGIIDYDRFIDEQLRESLTTAIVKEIPEEPRVTRREIPVATSENVCDKTCPLIIKRRGECGYLGANQVCRRKRIDTISVLYRLEAEIIQSRDSSIAERIMRRLKERRRVVDHYYLTKGFNYFEDVCKCSLACVLYTLSRDQFVRSVFASLALFAVGLKLCSELDAWEMPSRAS